jgi:hypothetical protein
MMTQNKDFYWEVVLEHIKKNKDNSIKEIGDIVLMWDTSRLTDIETGEVNTDLLDHAMLCTFPSIVIEHGLRINKDIVLDDRVYPCNLDIMIWNKTLDKKFYTKSEFVKITTNKL